MIENLKAREIEIIRLRYCGSEMETSRLNLKLEITMKKQHLRSW